jgi:serine/threonine-protein kinase
MMGKGVRMSYGLSASIGADVAGALHAAHELRGPDQSLLEIVHRDVSPQNVILTYDGRVKLTDFGIAKALGRLQRTVPGEIKGKLAYMSPEQAFGRDVDRRSDVYSLGIVLYELALGRRLFGGKSDAETVRNIMNHVIPAPRSLDPTFPAGMEEIILGMLTKDVTQRFQSAGAVERALRAFVATSGETDLEARRSEFVRSLDPVRFQAKSELVNRELARLGMIPQALRSGPRKASRYAQDDEDPPTVELRLPEQARSPSGGVKPRPATQPPAPRDPFGPPSRVAEEEPVSEPSPFERTILAPKPTAPPVTPRPPPRPVSVPPVSNPPVSNPPLGGQQSQYQGFLQGPFGPPQPPVVAPQDPKAKGPWLLLGVLAGAVVLFSVLAAVVWRFVLQR